MSLSGNLGFVPIDEVLRMLTRAKQQGSVEVMGSGLHGRVFVGRGGIDLATIWTDDDLHRHLVNSGTADESTLRRIKSGETTLAAIADSNQAMVDLIREITVESLFQIGARGDEFEVDEGSTTPYASPNSFELERVLEDSRDRKREWDAVAGIVSDLTGAVGFRRDLGERDEVTVKRDDWRVLSEIGLGASVSEIAEQLGTTEFWAARVAARLIEEDLIEFRPGVGASGPGGWHDEISTPTTIAPVPESTPFLAQEPGPVEYETYEEPAVDQVEQFVEQETDEFDNREIFASADTDPETRHAEDTMAPAEETTDGSNANASWWQEPEVETPTADDVRAPEVVAEGLSEMPAVSADESEVEEDTEAFLEKVFSELESTEPGTDEGHGLLRRRRMGSLRDFSSDS